jgi:hypothetical protein
VETDWRTRLVAFKSGELRTVAPYALLAALGCLVLAAALWKRPALTEFSGKTTVAVDGVLTEAGGARAEAQPRPITTHESA